MSSIDTKAIAKAAAKEAKDMAKAAAKAVKDAEKAAAKAAKDAEKAAAKAAKAALPKRPVGRPKKSGSSSSSVVSAPMLDYNGLGSEPKGPKSLPVLDLPDRNERIARLKEMMRTMFDELCELENH